AAAPPRSRPRARPWGQDRSRPRGRAGSTGRRRRRSPAPAWRRLRSLRLLDQLRMDLGLPQILLLPKVEMTGIQVTVTGLVQQLRPLVTEPEPVRAARGERAPLGQLEQRRRQPGDRREPPRLRPVQPRDGPEQAPGVGVAGVVEDVPPAALLDDP